MRFIGCAGAGVTVSKVGFVISQLLTQFNLVNQRSILQYRLFLGFCQRSKLPLADLVFNLRQFSILALQGNLLFLLLDKALIHILGFLAFGFTALRLRFVGLIIPPFSKTVINQLLTSSLELWITG